MSTEAIAEPRIRTRLRIRAPFLVAALLLAAAGAFGFQHYLYTLGCETTDDAFVEGSMSFLASRIPGKVEEVTVAQHARVKRGQVLVRLDPSDAQARVSRAEADLAAARNRMAAAEAAAAAADAERKAAEVELWRSQRELERVESLVESHAASAQDLDRARATHDAAEARVRALTLHAEAERAVLGNQAPVRQAEAELEQARLTLSHTELAAPFDGIVGRKNVEPGAVLAAGQPLLALTADQDSWVIANFKETQIQRMRIGQRAEVRVDAYPDVVWRGHVDSLSPATGAKYALIPPDHASGNFTKVVQRIPVKIVLDGVESSSGDALPATLLSGNGPTALPIGLSAEVKVVVR